MNKENFIINSNKKSPNNSTNALKCIPKSTKTQPKQIINSHNDHHDDIMRLIIAENSQYFQNKIEGPKNGVVKDLKLKIPCQTGMTVYCKDYKQKQNNYKNKQQIQHNKSGGNIKNESTLRMNIQHINIDNKTSYQQDFKNQLIQSKSCRRFNKKISNNQQDNLSPGFFQTQNKVDFLNWGGQNYIASMKPFYKSAATNIIFQGNTSYRDEFDGRPSPKTPICMKQSSFPKFGNINMMVKSSYAHEFSYKKNNRKEPKYRQKSSCKTNLRQQFKGSTEYKRQFKQLQKQPTREIEYRSIQDLQNLIIDL